MPHPRQEGKNANLFKNGAKLEDWKGQTCNRIGKNLRSNFHFCGNSAVSKVTRSASNCRINNFDPPKSFQSTLKVTYPRLRLNICCKNRKISSKHGELCTQVRLEGIQCLQFPQSLQTKCAPVFEKSKARWQPLSQHNYPSSSRVPAETGANLALIAIRIITYLRWPKQH